MKIRYRSNVREDVRGAALWYEERLEGLGRRFLAAARATRDRILENPRLYPKVRGEIRRAPLAEPFPHQMFYRLLEDQVVEVLAVLHPARDPAIWQRRAE